MTEHSRKGRFDDDGQDICPYCGAPLLTRTDYRTHLTLKSCVEDGNWDIPKPLRDEDVRPTLAPGRESATIKKD